MTDSMRGARIAQKSISIPSLLLPEASRLIKSRISTVRKTEEMIRMMNVLVAKYKNLKRIYLSWDAASWHVSKHLNEHIENHNTSGNWPVVATAPLPARAQFLNVIESIFSGMARAIIQNSNYASVDDYQ